MTTKENILKLIDAEMTSLITSYEEGIKEIGQQVEIWKERVNYLELENAKLKKQIAAIFSPTYGNFEFLLFQIKRLNGDIPYDLVDNWCLSSSVEDSILLLTACNELWINRDLIKLNYIAELIIHNHRILHHDDKKLSNTFLTFIEKVLSDETVQDEEYEKFLLNIIKILNLQQTSTFNKEIAEFVRKFYKEIYDQVLTINHPEEIIKFLRVLMAYELESEVKSALIHILDVEWEFIDSTLTSNNFTVLLWYCYLFDFDDDFIALALKSIQWFDQDNVDQKLYFYIYEDGEFDSREYQEKVNEFISGTVLSDFEKKLVLQKVESKLMLADQETSKTPAKISVEESKNHRAQSIMTSEISQSDVQDKFKTVNALDLLNDLLEEENYGRFSKVAHAFTEQVNPVVYSLESIRKLENLLNKVFMIEPKDFNEYKAWEDMFFETLSIILLFSKKEIIRGVINKNEQNINNLILNSRSPKLLLKLAEFYFNNNHHDKLTTVFNNVFHQWDLTIISFDDKNFTKLLWYFFYFNQEIKFIKALGSKSLFEKYNYLPEVEMFNLFQKVKDGRINFEVGKAQITTLKEKVKLFDEEEFQKINKKLQKKLKMSVKKNRLQDLKQEVISPENKSLKKIAFVTRLPSDDLILKKLQNNLQKQLVQLAIYRDPFLKDHSGYTLVEVLADKQTGKLYVNEVGIRALKKQIGSKWPDIRAYKEEVPKVQKTTDVDSNSFAWPSTDLKGNNGQEERTQLNEESQLKKMGYQITGMTRSKRWQILEVAVKNLGLKKVAYTIAQNVKLRKGQKNGETKFSYAIGEWENDLKMLKEKFYKNDFTWPTTKVSH